MSDLSTFTADHHGFYLNEAPFYPFFEEGLEFSNTALLRLSAHSGDSLDWAEEMAAAEKIVASGKYVLWEIDLGLNSMELSPTDSAGFYSLSLALEHFAKMVWPSFQTKTFGVVLYRGQFDPCRHFPLSHWETPFLEWSAGRKRGSDYELYCTQLLSEYLHRLVSFLPEEVLPFAWMEVPEGLSAGRQSQLFSNCRFEYVHLALKGAKIPFSGLCLDKTQPSGDATLGICLPCDELIDENVLQEMDSIIADLKTRGIAFRIVSEEKLTEEWDGLDELIVFSYALSPQGKRKLLGFEAAGGAILQFSELV